DWDRSGAEAHLLRVRQRRHLCGRGDARWRGLAGRCTRDPRYAHAGRRSKDARRLDLVRQRPRQLRPAVPGPQCPVILGPPLVLVLVLVLLLVLVLEGLSITSTSRS